MAALEWIGYHLCKERGGRGQELEQVVKPGFCNASHPQVNWVCRGCTWTANVGEGPGRDGALPSSGVSTSGKQRG